jgi:hypothetical protein
MPLKEICHFVASLRAAAGVVYRKQSDLFIHIHG